MAYERNNWLTPALLSEWDGEANTIAPLEARGPDKIWWKCPLNHSYQTCLNMKKVGKGCPYCTGKKILPGFNDAATKFSHLIKETLEDLSLVNISQKVTWRCSLNHEWAATVKTRAAGHGCPYCSNNKLLIGFNDFLSKFPELALELHPTKNTEVDFSQVIGAPKRKVWWLGKCNHEWAAELLNRAGGDGCPYCSGNKVLADFNDFASKYPHHVKEFDFKKNLFTPEEFTSGSNQKAWWVCVKGHSWECSFKDKASGRICYKCSKPFSNFEKIVVDYVSCIYEGEILERKRILKTNVNRLLELDVWLPEVKIAFEVQDFATHSRVSDGEETSYKNLGLLKSGPTKHELKRRLAKEQLNATLIDLWEDEILSGEYQKIIKNALQTAGGKAL